MSCTQFYCHHRRVGQWYRSQGVHKEDLGDKLELKRACCISWRREYSVKQRTWCHDKWFAKSVTHLFNVLFRIRIIMRGGNLLQFAIRQHMVFAGSSQRVSVILKNERRRRPAKWNETNPWVSISRRHWSAPHLLHLPPSCLFRKLFPINSDIAKSCTADQRHCQNFLKLTQCK